MTIIIIDDSNKELPPNTVSHLIRETIKKTEDDHTLIVTQQRLPLSGINREALTGFKDDIDDLMRQEALHAVVLKL